jgi:hypothetical protein
MIKARAGDLMVFGLSDRNLELLQQGRPIIIDLREIGLESGRVMILYGKTEKAITDELAKAATLPEGSRFQ